jgi:hypothetical protein
MKVFILLIAFYCFAGFFIFKWIFLQYMNATIILATGYLSSLLLIISLLVNNDLKFRKLNTCGNICFIVYGTLIGAFPIILTNTILLCINFFYLIRIYRAHEDFDLIEFKGSEKLVHKFLAFYQEDISAFFPAYVHQEMGDRLSFVVLRDLVIANIFVATLSDDGTAVVELNYTVPKYRDYKVGRFIFNKENTFLLSKGVKQLVYEQPLHKKHEGFIKVMGFKRELFAGNMYYVKHLL